MKRSQTGLNFHKSFPFYLAVILWPLWAQAKSIEIKTQEIKDQVWPRVVVTAHIDATPLESVAIFAAYDYQKNYIPNLIESKVHLEKVSANSNDTQVEYTLDMPWPLSDGHYIHGHKLTRPAPNSYKVEWYMVKSDSAEDVYGEALFEPSGPGKGTTLTYVSNVTPKSFFAGIFKKMMLKDVRASVEAIIKTTEEKTKNNPELVSKYSDKINKVLSGQEAY